MSSVASTSTSSLGNFLSANAATTVGGSSSSSSSQASSLAVSGLASGMNWQSVVLQLANAERSAEIPWRNEQSTINTQNAAYTTIKNDLTSVQTDVKALQDPTLFNSTQVQSSNSSIASVTSESGATLGNFTFNISQLASSAQMQGQSNISQVLVPGGNPANATIGTAGFSTPVTAGTFTINGAQINIATTDTLQTVFNNIATATNNAVTASYSATTDKITLSSSSPIVLGSAADTSNFLQVAQLYNNGGNSVSSAGALGRVNLTMDMSSANLATPVTSGAGQFSINGVNISYNSTSDSIQNVLDRINSSTAGVTAAYDPVNNRFTLTNKTTGDVGISMKDVTGNFLAATGLSGGTLQRGKNLLYTINGSSTQLVSQNNTITSDSSGINGLTVTALQTGTATISVNSDTSKISSAIQQFVKDYNSAESYISSQQLVSTGSNGAVTPGPLTGDTTASGIADNLRTTAFSDMPGLSGTIKMLSDLGIQTNGQDNTLKISDTTTLDNALANNLGDVKSFFTDTTNGWATQLNNYLDGVIGNNGTLTNHQASLTSQYSSLGTQISNLETKIASDSAQWTSEFQAMEQAQSQVNQELTYLSQAVSNGSL